MKNAIRYKITVSATIEALRTTGKEWRVVGQDIKADKPVDVYGHSPEVEKLVREEVQVYEQVVDGPIDIAALACVVNNLPDPRPQVKT